MDSSIKFKRKFWMKVIFLGFGLCVFMSINMLLVNFFTGKNYFNPWFFLIFCIAIILFIPFFVTKFYLPKHKVSKEYKQLEESLKERGDDLIISVFGEKIFQKLYVEDLNWIPVDGLDVCMDLLSKEEVKNDEELRFYIYVRMAEFYFKDGSYSNSLKCLKKSISIKPSNFIANYRIAEISERLGLVEQSLAYYECAADSPEIPGSLKEYVIYRIERIKTTGPITKKAPSGLKWLGG